MKALSPTPAFLGGLQALDLQPDPVALDLMGQYLALLLEANQHLNLTSVTDPDAVWLRHLLDSLTLAPHLAEGRTLVDVGSGGGLPGIPLAILRPDVSVTLLEATGKKADFLHQTVEALGLSSTTVITARAENAGRDPGHREQYDAAVSRAVAPLPALLELMAPLVRVGGRLLMLKGQAAEVELQDATRAMELLDVNWVGTHRTFPGQDNETIVLEVAKQGPTASAYPRRDGRPAKRPLR